MKKYAVFGNPIEHSMSPLIHAYFAKNLGIKLTYEAILGTIGKFELEAKNFLKTGGRGFNVTLPFKQEAYNFFVIMLTRIRHRVVYFILKSRLVIEL